ncbi:MAG: nucleoside 2-deoxyribosyltransferase domain-containing protein [Chitinophagales bacterium]|nr:nucleoside 2-deoxyribosyltransferase domain-containing protein [Chitinophagales bacterium]
MNNGHQIRTLFSRDHDTVFQKLGVFLGGPTPPSGEMLNGWRRVIMDKLQADSRLDPSMIVVAPEPESGHWDDIDNFHPKNELEVVHDKQMPWELQYLNLCDITTFWLPTYWTEEKAAPFAPNIGPTSRWEFGFFFQEYLKNPAKRNFIIGSPEDAESIKWAKKITDIYGIKWHFLKEEDKSKLVADSFIEEIAQTLIQNKWQY